MQRVISALHVTLDQTSHAYQLWCLPLLTKLHSSRPLIATKLDYSQAIKTQRFHRGTACWRQSNDMRSTGAPRKMVRPYVLLGVEQRDCTTRNGGRELIGAWLYGDCTWDNSNIDCPIGCGPRHSVA